MGGVLRQTYILSRSYPAVAESVPRARRALVLFAREAGADDMQVDALRLAASEAVTNAVRHAYGDEPGEVQLTAALAGDELWVLVSDDGHGLHQASHNPGLGMGLALISRVSDDLCVLTRASGGTELHMRFALRADRTGGQAGSDRIRGRDAAGPIRGRDAADWSRGHEASGRVRGQGASDARGLVASASSPASPRFSTTR